MYLKDKIQETSAIIAIYRFPYLDDKKLLLPRQINDGCIFKSKI